MTVFDQKMVLRKAAVALLLLRIIANRRSLNAAVIAQNLARIRAFLSKYPLLSTVFAAVEKLAVALLQRVRGHADRAAAAATSTLQGHSLHSITNTRWFSVASVIIRNIMAVILQLMVKVDSAMKGLAPFARFRIVCNVMRREQRAPLAHPHVSPCDTMLQVELCLKAFAVSSGWMTLSLRC